MVEDKRQNIELQRKAAQMIREGYYDYDELKACTTIAEMNELQAARLEDNASAVEFELDQSETNEALAIEQMGEPEVEEPGEETEVTKLAFDSGRSSAGGGSGFTMESIRKMKPAEFNRNLAKILQASREGKISGEGK